MDYQPAIKIIQTLHLAGATPAQVATKLNQEGISTFSGLGRWHAMTVNKAMRKAMRKNKQDSR